MKIGRHQQPAGSIAVMFNELKLTKPLCADRYRLSTEVTKAIQESYAAKGDYERAIKQEMDSAPFSWLLAEARVAERNAIAALEKHRKEHRCELA